MKNITKNEPIGILGGMGPDASARLYQVMINMARDEFGARQNEEDPELVIYSIPVPDFISDMSRSEEAMFMLKQRVRNLSNLPMSCMALACNTAHTTLVDLEQETRVPFVSIIEAVASEASRLRYTRVGLLASPATIYSGAYQNVLRDKGIDTVVPSHEVAEELGAIIGGIVAGEFKPAKKKLLVIADGLKKKGCEALILGCTELPLVFPKNYSLPVLDCVEILARALLKRYYNFMEKV